MRAWVTETPITCLGSLKSVVSVMDPDEIIQLVTRQIN